MSARSFSPADITPSRPCVCVWESTDSGNCSGSSRTFVNVDFGSFGRCPWFALCLRSQVFLLLPGSHQYSTRLPCEDKCLLHTCSPLQREAPPHLLTTQKNNRSMSYKYSWVKSTRVSDVHPFSVVGVQYLSLLSPRGEYIILQRLGRSWIRAGRVEDSRGSRGELVLMRLLALLVRLCVTPRERREVNTLRWAWVSRQTRVWSD